MQILEGVEWRGVSIESFCQHTCSSTFHTWHVLLPFTACCISFSMSFCRLHTRLHNKPTRPASRHCGIHRTQPLVLPVALNPIGTSSTSLPTQTLLSLEQQLQPCTRLEISQHMQDKVQTATALTATGIAQTLHLNMVAYHN